MPLLLKKKYPQEVEWSIWLKTESNEALLDFIPQGFTADLKPEDWTGLPSKLGERLAARAALSQLFDHSSGAKWQLNKCSNGKPHLVASEEIKISISHSYNLAAAIKAPVDCGIDIQAIQDKIFAIQSKFATKRETGSNPSAAHLHVLWGAKEAMYKAFGKRGLDFKADLYLKPFEYQPNGGATLGVVNKDEIKVSFEIQYLPIRHQMLVWAIQKIDAK